MNASPRRFGELDYYNAVACLLVILIHVLSLGVTSAAPDSALLLAVFLPWSLSQFVVPAFLISGAMKLSLGGGRKTGYLEYICGRVVKIFMPYVLWTTIYYLAFLPVGYAEKGLKAFLTYLLTGSVASPFYYVIVVMQFYLLRPLWKLLRDRAPWFVALPCAAVINALALRSEDVLALLGIRFVWADRIFPSYILFWTLGLYIGKHYGALREALRKSLRFQTGPLVLLIGFALASYLQYARGIYLFDLGFIKLVTDCMASLALLSLCLALERRPESAPALLLSRVYPASFQVYLSHCLFLALGTLWLERLGVTGTVPLLLCRAAICYTLPFALYRLTSWIPKLIRGKTG